GSAVAASARVQDSGSISSGNTPDPVPDHASSAVGGGPRGWKSTYANALATRLTYAADPVKVHATELTYMAQPFQRQTEVLLRAVAGCSVLSSCLVASAATTYDLSGGGALQVAAPVYVVDFTTSAPADPGLATTSGLGGSGGSAGYDASRADGLP